MMHDDSQGADLVRVDSSLLVNRVLNKLRPGLLKIPHSPKQCRRFQAYEGPAYYPEFLYTDALTLK